MCTPTAYWRLAQRTPLMTVLAPLRFISLRLSRAFITPHHFSNVIRATTGRRCGKLICGTFNHYWALLSNLLVCVSPHNPWIIALLLKSTFSWQQLKKRKTLLCVAHTQKPHLCPLVTNRERLTKGCTAVVAFASHFRPFHLGNLEQSADASSLSSSYRWAVS